MSLTKLKPPLRSTRSTPSDKISGFFWEWHIFKLYISLWVFRPNLGSTTIRICLKYRKHPCKKKTRFCKVRKSKKWDIWRKPSCVSFFQRGWVFALFWGADSPRSLTNITPVGWPFGKVIVLRWDDLGMILLPSELPTKKPMVLATNKLAFAFHDDLRKTHRIPKPFRNSGFRLLPIFRWTFFTCYI